MGEFVPDLLARQSVAGRKYDRTIFPPAHVFGVLQCAKKPAIVPIRYRRVLGIRGNSHKGQIDSLSARRHVYVRSGSFAEYFFDRPGSRLASPAEQPGFIIVKYGRRCEKSDLLFSWHLAHSIQYALEPFCQSVVYTGRVCVFYDVCKHVGVHDQKYALPSDHSNLRSPQLSNPLHDRICPAVSLRPRLG